MPEPKQSGPQDFTAGGSSAHPDVAEIELVRKILNIFANAVSASRLYPPEHQTVADFVSLLYEHLRTFLQSHWKLELGVEETAFTYKGERVYEDPHPVRSLPFFFSKDGLQALFFYQGLQKEEVGEFLKTIRHVSLLPPEEADIVNALWEKDLANIRYLAPDDYLETKIGVGRPPLAVTVDRMELNRGKIKLEPDDLSALQESLAQTALAGVSRSNLEQVLLPADNLLAGLPEEDTTREVESLLLSNRNLSPHEEYLNLIIEIIYHEDRTDQFPAIAEVLEQYHQDALDRLDFGRATSLLQSLREMEAALVEKDAVKARVISDLINELTQEAALSRLKEKQDLVSEREKQALLDYLKIVGPSAAEISADLFEKWTDPDLRRQLHEILDRIGKADIEALMRAAQDSRPESTKAVIGILSRIQDRRIAPFLAKFVSSRHPSVKIEAVRALARIEDRAAGRILLNYIAAPEGPVRLAALKHLPADREGSLEDSILRLVSEKSFLKKDPEEIEAFFGVLSRSNSADGCRVLRRFMLQGSLFPQPKLLGIRMSAAHALARMSRPEATEALRAGAACRTKKIRQVCRQALREKNAESG